jgi:hypothetical protein
MVLGRKLLIGSILLLGGCFLVESVRLPICHFLMRDFNGIYVEVMRKCPAGLIYILNFGYNLKVLRYKLLRGTGL